MKKLLTILFAVALGLNLSAQTDYVETWDPDADGDDLIGITDLLALLSLFAEADSDGDGIWDSVDDCIGVYDPCGVCNGTGEDVDEDGLCDDADDCVGEYDECGLCNGPGPTFPVIDEILYATDSVFLDPLDEWYVFEYATDTLFTFACPVSGCTDETASNYDPEAVIEDGSCAYGPLECGGASTVTFDGYTYDLVAIGEQCWFAENLRTEHYSNGDVIPANLSDDEWSSTTSGGVTVYGEGTSFMWGGETDENVNLVAYGRLYNWYAVDDERGLCPTGWHVPTDGEWMTLEMELGMSEDDANSGCCLGRGTDEGTQLKASPEDIPSWDGSNVSGFRGLGGGYRGDAGFFGNESDVGYFWTSSSEDGTAWDRRLTVDFSEVQRVNSVEDYGPGFSVRCLKGE